MAVFDRVVQEVLEDLRQLIRFAKHVRQAGYEIEGDMHAARLCPQFERRGDAAEHMAEICSAGWRQVFVHLDPRER